MVKMWMIIIIGSNSPSRHPTGGVVRGTILLLFIEHHFDAGLLAHECYHAAKIITENTGISDDESTAYIIDYLVNENCKTFNDILQKNLIQIEMPDVILPSPIINPIKCTDASKSKP